MHIDFPQRQLAISVSPEHLHYDPVLGLPDRFGLGDIIEQVIEQSVQRDVSVGYFVIGIDRMKLIHQAFGPSIGHEVLSAAAQTLVRFCADRAHVCWLGGDLFAVLMMNVAPNEIGARASEMLKLFRDPQHPWPKGVHVTASVGGVAVSPLLPTAHEVMVAGETALHQAKTAGRNCVAVFENRVEEKQSLRDSLLLANRVQRALHDNTLHLAYQPVVCSATGKVLFYEALARLFDDHGQAIPAAHFMPSVERLGMVYQLDCRVLTMAVTELRSNATLQLAVNIAASTAEHPDWTGYLETVLEGRRDLAGRLIIEITETIPIRDIDVTRKFVEFTKSLGGKVALDDFGSGYTTVQHLTGLNVHLMKLDRTMVAGIHNSEQRQKIMRAMISLARSLGLEIIAEGVEDSEVAAWLKAEKVDMQQGYHHGHPSFDKPWRSVA